MVDTTDPLVTLFGTITELSWYLHIQGITYIGPITNSANVTIEAIPIPAAVWLFGSGLIGLIGVARRKKA